MTNPWAVLRKEKDYARLFAAGIVNGMGDRFSQVAVLGLVLSLTGSGLAVGITFAIRLIPYLIFGPLGGVLADRLSKKRVMIATDLIRAVFALTPLLVREPADIWLIYVSSFLLSAGEAIYAPARMSAIPRLVRKEHLLQVNSLEEVMTGLVLIGGSISGGFVAALLGVEVSFLLNAFSFLATALLLARLPQLRGAAPDGTSAHGLGQAAPAKSADGAALQASAPAGAQASAPAGTPAAAAFRELLARSPFLRLMLLIFAVWPIGDGIFNILLSVYAVEVFHMGDLGIGLLYGALGAGLVAGSALTGRFARQIKAAAVLTLLLEGICHILISQSGSFGLLVVLLAGTAICSGIGNACNQTILMMIVPEEIRGRFMGTLAALQNTIMGAAMFLGGLLLEVLSPRMLGLIGGGLLTLSGAVFAILYCASRTLRAAPVSGDISE
ncbi:MFS transporter [Paenibacillus faecis]|uniref:MFS transporter n=1 Tax=Paenibacillus faecis TaxID=862114 RepID=UPI001B246612|nr:MFS transporter [Paenibacillus faecis]GIO86895.1 MFS transporter [Paenibacillus faecis]